MLLFEDTITPTKTTQFGTPVEKRIDLVKDGAMEAEVRAAKERAMVPLDVRVKSFKEMLKEKEVSKIFNLIFKTLMKIIRELDIISRCQHFQHGKRSCIRLSLIRGICCWQVRKESRYLKNI